MNTSPLTQMALADRLRHVRVGIRAELEVSRQRFHGEPAYVIRDPITFQTHKLSNEDYQIFVALDAQEELHRVFDKLCDRGLLDRSREEDFYRFIVHLNHVGLLTLPVSQGKSLYERFERRRRLERRAKWQSILFLRVPLFHPDTFLSRTVRWFRPLFTPTAFALWLVALAACAIVLAANWDEFRSPLATMLTLRHLPLLWLLLVGLKAVHEFGHAYACKRFGGTVPEMGAYFILFTPCAYVDASAAWGFARRQRVVVGLAGMYFESIAAMIGVAVWTLTGPGMVHAAAQYAIVLATIVTIGFNANPLMRYDGYYILSDLLGMPNLRQDARRQLLTELKRVLFGVDVRGTARSVRARVGLALFGVASQLYRMTVLLGICVLLAFKVPVIGVGAAVAFLLQTLWHAVTGVVRYVAFAAETAPVRRRAVCVTMLLTCLVAGTVAALPAPGALIADGVVQREEEHIVYARVPGFLDECFVRDGQFVTPDTVLARLQNRDLQRRVVRKRHELEQLRLAAYHELPRDRSAATVRRHRWARERQALSKLHEEERELEVRAGVTGIVVDAQPLEGCGRYIQRGEALAVIGRGPWRVRAVLHAETMAQARPHVGQHVELRLRNAAGTPLCGTIVRIDPAGSPHVRHASLTHLAGGSIAVDPHHRTAANPYFEIVIRIESTSDGTAVALRSGMTAVVRLGRSSLPLGKLLYLRALQLFDRVCMAR